MNVFVLDDDEETRDVVGSALTRDGHKVTLAGSFDEAVARLAASTFDVLVLDVMLGPHSGLELCTTIRAQGVETPTLFLSARGAVRARVEGFDAGGDDYLAKPFALKELTARVRALGRRGPALHPSKCVLGPIVLDFTRRHAHAPCQRISLTAREWEVLELLSRARGRVVPFDSLLERAWDDTSDKSRASLAVIVSRLRRKLSRDSTEPVIRTVHGVGYALEHQS